MRKIVVTISDENQVAHSNQPASSLYVIIIFMHLNFMLVFNLVELVEFLVDFDDARFFQKLLSVSLDRFRPDVNKTWMYKLMHYMNVQQNNYWLRLSMK